VSTGCHRPLESRTFTGTVDCFNVRVPSGFAYSVANIERLTGWERCASNCCPPASGAKFACGSAGAGGAGAAGTGAGGGSGRRRGGGDQVPGS
jgi:hypothetical protein